MFGKISIRIALSFSAWFVAARSTAIDLTGAHGPWVQGWGGPRGLGLWAQGALPNSPGAWAWASGTLAQGVGHPRGQGP